MQSQHLQLQFTSAHFICILTAVHLNHVHHSAVLLHGVYKVLLVIYLH